MTLAGKTEKQSRARNGGAPVEATPRQCLDEEAGGSDKGRWWQEERCESDEKEMREIRDRERDTKQRCNTKGARSRTWLQWPEVVGGDRRWPEGVVAVGAAEREKKVVVERGAARGRRRERGLANLVP